MFVTTKIETRQFARAIAAWLRPGDVIRLDGGLGAGKTTVVQWIAEALGVHDEVTSPTFSLIHCYESPHFMLYHLDLYRLEDPQELEVIDIDEVFTPLNAVTFIEWAQRAEEELPPHAFRLSLTPSVPKVAGEAVASDAVEQAREIHFEASPEDAEGCRRVADFWAHFRSSESRKAEEKG